MMHEQAIRILSRERMFLTLQARDYLSLGWTTDSEHQWNRDSARNCGQDVDRLTDSIEALKREDRGGIGRSGL